MVATKKNVMSFDHVKYQKLCVAANNGNILGEEVISASPENLCQGIK
jgi:hypothetical protein